MRTTLRMSLSNDRANRNGFYLRRWVAFAWRGVGLLTAVAAAIGVEGCASLPTPPGCPFGTYPSIFAGEGGDDAGGSAEVDPAKKEGNATGFYRGKSRTDWQCRPLCGDRATVELMRYPDGREVIRCEPGTIRANEPLAPALPRAADPSVAAARAPAPELPPPEPARPASAGAPIDAAPTVR